MTLSPCKKRFRVGPRCKPVFQFARRLNSSWNAISFMAALAANLPTQAGPIATPNASFESPYTFFATPMLDSWQLTPQPAWWNQAAAGPWANLAGVFKNDPPTSSAHIANCDGNQAAWLYANPDAGFFQDYDSMDWNDGLPSHAFDATYEPGKAYELTVGLFGGGAGGNYGMLLGVTLELSLYYRDAASNRVTVAATTITNSAELFTSNTNLVDFAVNVPTVQPGDAWAGQHIGIQILSTVRPEMQGGYWDLDNVRLVSILAPQLVNPTVTNHQFQFTLRSEPGLRFDLLASTNAALPIASWTRLGSITNTTGETPCVDTASNFQHRFYRAQQLP
jgi:hypothetical protein